MQTVFSSWYEKKISNQKSMNTNKTAKQMTKAITIGMENLGIDILEGRGYNDEVFQGNKLSLSCSVKCSIQ